MQRYYTLATLSGDYANEAGCWSASAQKDLLHPNCLNFFSFSSAQKPQAMNIPLTFGPEISQNLHFFSSKEASNKSKKRDTDYSRVTQVKG